MHKVSNFLGWENVLGSIEQGTLIAINKSIGFYHGHLMIRGNKLRIENDPDIFLMNPIENFDGTFRFPEHHRFYLMGAESALFGLDEVSFPFGDPMEGVYDPKGRNIAFGGVFHDKGLDTPYYVTSGYKDICSQLKYFGVPPGYETAISQLEFHFTGRKYVDDLSRDDEGNPMIIPFTG